MVYSFNSCSFNSSQLYGPFITTTLGTNLKCDDFEKILKMCLNALQNEVLGTNLKCDDFEKILKMCLNALQNEVLGTNLKLGFTLFMGSLVS